MHMINLPKQTLDTNERPLWLESCVIIDDEPEGLEEGTLGAQLVRELRANEWREEN